MSEQIITKRCSKCKKFKPLSKFYICPKGKHGFGSSCKICECIRKTKYNKTKNGKAAIKRYAQSTKGKVSIKRYQHSEKHKQVYKKYYLENPNKRQARSAVSNAIRNGKLPRPVTLQCYYCPEQAKQYHHNLGYAPKHWFDIIPVCRKCHIKTLIKKTVAQPDQGGALSCRF